MNVLKPSSYNPLLVLCVTLALVVAIVAQQLYLLSLRQGVYLQNRNYAVYLGMQELYKTRKASIVMFGDSHSTWAHWDEMFGRSDIINRGIPNDISQGLRERCHFIVDLHPKLCFVESGINDLYAGFSVDEIVDEMHGVVQQLQDAHCEVVLQSVFPVAHSYTNAENINAQIPLLNAQLQQMCAEKHIQFLELYKELSKDGYLNDALTYDGIHLNAQGYALWKKQIASLVAAIPVDTEHAH